MPISGEMSHRVQFYFVLFFSSLPSLLAGMRIILSLWPRFSLSLVLARSLRSCHSYRQTGTQRSQLKPVLPLLALFSRFISVCAFFFSLLFLSFQFSLLLLLLLLLPFFYLNKCVHFHVTHGHRLCYARINISIVHLKIIVRFAVPFHSHPMGWW